MSNDPAPEPSDLAEAIDEIRSLRIECTRLRLVLDEIDNKIGHFRSLPMSADMPMVSILVEIAQIAGAAKKHE